MFSFLPKPVVGVISVLLYFFNTLFWFVPVTLLAILKLPPITRWQSWMTYLLDACAVAWISVNNFTTRLFTRIRWNVQGLEQLSRKDWYLLLANHQSWADILVLQNIFNRKIPFIKFFLKKELIYVPLLGICWWALDFPFMKRYSKHFLQKNPQLQGKDIETTRKACLKFQFKPTTVMNFVEGTRFTKAKHDMQQSPFSHLLKPKAGGVAFVLGAMGNQLHKMLNVTIYYPQGIPSFWDYISGKVRDITVNINVLPISSDLIGDYNDPNYREHFQQWVNQLWQQKDRELAALAEKGVS
ncbi:MAG: acyltransferase [Rheinheimera sp.]|uniref:acyltransferase n=1 Tax=Arsukibacterium sp. UBA3155 TaxID=1946058 RepID=UPI000C98E769|nr:acyltransferase [Arsukibacterium sp. UBA3155]MAD73229.1 acyltransferase [Rheinheimera sp.]|tara:strand:+ start:61682 stop:62575 length:894 start_codon:yes stop_codon:yes gene_type:complete